jgi:hypothetical protein
MKTCKCERHPYEDILVKDIYNPICPDCKLPLLSKPSKHKHKIEFVGNGSYECKICHVRQGIKLIL